MLTADAVFSRPKAYHNSSKLRFLGPPIKVPAAPIKIPGAPIKVSGPPH